MVIVISDFKMGSRISKEIERTPESSIIHLIYF